MFTRGSLIKLHLPSFTTVYREGGQPNIFLGVPFIYIYMGVSKNNGIPKMDGL